MLYENARFEMKLMSNKLYITFKFNHKDHPAISDFVKRHIELFRDIKITQFIFDTMVTSLNEFLDTIVVPYIVTKENNFQYTHNMKIYANMIKCFNVESHHDIRFIANKFGKFYKKYDCIDNYRICKSDVSGTKSHDYINIQTSGCCGSFDKLIYNQLTNNYFMIGFNHGH